MIGMVKMHELDVDDDYSLRGTTLQTAIEVCTMETNMTLDAVIYRGIHTTYITCHLTK